MGDPKVKNTHTLPSTLQIHHGRCVIHYKAVQYVTRFMRKIQTAQRRGREMISEQDQEKGDKEAFWEGEMVFGLGLAVRIGF